MNLYSTVFSTDLGQTVLVFVLVFTLIFAILQKSKILGDGKKQIDALVALAIGLMVISVGYAMDMITKMIPFLAVSIVIILVFLVLFGFFGKKELVISDGVRTFFGILAFVAVVLAVLYFGNLFGTIYSFFTGNSSVVGNLLLLVVVAVAIWIALRKNGDSSDKKD